MLAMLSSQPRTVQFLVTLIMVAFNPIIIQASIHNRQEGTSAINDAHPCSLYLAKSSIPHAGWGVFTARDYKLGDRIGNPGIAIPFLDRPLKDNATIYGALSEYLWESAEIGGFGESRRVDLFLPGPASLINHHAALDNVLAGGLTLDENLYRETNPMAGSSSSYYNFSLIAKRDITAGEELFVDRTRNAQFISYLYKKSDSLGRLPPPSEEDYDRADEIVGGIGEAQLELSESQWTDVLYRIRTEILPVGQSTTSSEQQSILAQLLPKTKRQLDKALTMGTARMHLIDRDSKSFHGHNNSGYCLDSIRVSHSTIPHAGRGAFTTRGLQAGEIISTSPLVTITNGPQAMRVPPIHPQTRGKQPLQLLLNYCFSHRKSDLMLCPTTFGAFINHDQENANVALRWATGAAEEDLDLTTESIDSLAVNGTIWESYNTRLVLQYVALRPIREGEELLLDYSQEWEGALKQHLERGYSTINSHQYKPAHAMNSEKQPIVLSSEIDAKNLTYFCQAYPSIVGSADPRAWEEFPSNRDIDQDNWPTTFFHWYRDKEYASLYPCKVVNVDRARNMYDVELLRKPVLNGRVLRRYRNVPGNRIRYADGMYQSDMHLSTAFRHYIPLPDSIFPLRWRADYFQASHWKLGTLSNTKQSQTLEEEYERTLREVKCGMYLAPSNIPNAGFGTYTAVDIPAGGIMVSTSMPAIPVLGVHSDIKREGHFWPGIEYVWVGFAFPPADIEGWPSTSVSMLAVLFGALANSHTGITNLYRDSGVWAPTLDRTQDVGAGAFSDYFNYGFRTEYPVGAGEELFVSYGEHWFRVRSEFDSVPLKQNFAEADAILSSVWSMASINGHPIDNTTVPKLLNLTSNYFLENTNERTRRALDAVQTLEEIGRIVERNGTAKATVDVKSQEWLERNGYCQDHLYVKASTIKQAGNGAFSRRFLPKGSLVIAAPSIATPREYLSVNTSHLSYPTNELQLMTNYHFGHKNSSVLFFPLNQILAINHKSSLTGDRKGPNARIEFSKTEKKSNYFQSLPLEDLRKENHAVMVMDVIATRDIHPDEEVFIDYGRDWEEAWNKHIRNWKNPCTGQDTKLCFESSKRVHNMNLDKLNPQYHEWSQTHVSTCLFNRTVLEKEGVNYVIVKEMPVEHSADEQIRYSFQGIDYHHEGFSLPVYQTKDSQHVPCKILHSDPNNQIFDVVYFIGPMQAVPGGMQIVRVRSLPEDHVTFHLRGFKSDMMNPGAFRSEIAIPDKYFPSHWKDLE